MELIQDLERDGKCQLEDIPPFMRHKKKIHPLHFWARSGRYTVVGKFILQPNLAIQTDHNPRQHADCVCADCRCSRIPDFDNHTH